MLRRGLIMAGTGVAIAASVVMGIALAREPQKRFEPLLSAKETIVGEPIVYPQGQGKLITGILTLDPGDETGWHTHGVPLTGLLLEGELTVDYGDKGKRTYKAGQSLAEAINVPHNGKNTGSGALRLFVVFISAEGVETTRKVER